MGEASQDIRALIVVVSYARAEARPDSDLDVLLLAADPLVLLRDPSWIAALGDVLRFQVERYGRVTALRAHFRDGLEAELGVAHSAWASVPYDPGTYGVASGGIEVIVDRDGAAKQLAATVAHEVRRPTSR